VRATLPSEPLQNPQPLARATVDGNIVQAMQYDLFGNLLSQQGNVVRLPLGLAGGLFDADTGRISPPQSKRLLPAVRWKEPFALAEGVRGKSFPPAAGGRLVLNGSRGCASGVIPYPQHFLNFLPEPQGQGSLRPVLGPRTMGSWERILPSV